MDEKKMLGVLLHTTEQQCQTTEKLLIQLKDHVSSLEAATKLAQNAIPTIEKATRDAAKSAVRDVLTEAPKIALKAFEGASQPFLGRLKQAAEAAVEAEGQIREAAVWFSWKVGAIAAGAVAAAGLLGWAGIWWEQSQVVSLREQKAALQLEVSQLNAQAADLSRHGGRIKLSTCGPTGRLCVLASPNQDGEERNWKGPWVDNTTGQQYVIPKGY